MSKALDRIRSFFKSVGKVIQDYWQWFVAGIALLFGVIFGVRRKDSIPVARPEEVQKVEEDSREKLEDQLNELSSESRKQENEVVERLEREADSLVRDRQRLAEEMKDEL